jgi:hypothetical protein
MNRTANINAIVNKAKQDRADFIGAKLQAGILPVALAAVVSLALVSLSSDSTQDQAETNPVVEVAAELG